MTSNSQALRRAMLISAPVQRQTRPLHPQFSGLELSAPPSPSSLSSSLAANTVSIFSLMFLFHPFQLPLLEAKSSWTRLNSRESCSGWVSTTSFPSSFHYCFYLQGKIKMLTILMCLFVWDRILLYVPRLALNPLRCLGWPPTHDHSSSLGLIVLGLQA